MDKYLISQNPHVHSSASSAKLMADVIVALLPATVVSVLFYGWAELGVIAVGVLSCVLIELAISKLLMKKSNLFCGSAAVVTGLLLALNLPATTPWWVVFIGSLVAIGVAKMSFGGLGQNLFNPAITGRVFLLISFPTYMTNWNYSPGFIHADAFSGATLLGVYNEGGVEALNALDLDYKRLLFLNMGGSAGELCALALLAGFIYLCIRKTIKPWITLSIFATIAIISGIFYSVDSTLYTGPLFNLLTGGVILGACFMATDYVTSPMTTPGGIIYGVGIGFIVMMIRYFGAYPEGMSFAILIMNMFVPLIDRAFHNKKFGRA